MGKLSNLKLCFADIETTGLDEYQHEIIEIAAVIYDPATDAVIDEWEKKVAPQRIETASAEALRINGYVENPASYTGSLSSAMIKFNSTAKDCIIVGQNIDFDLRFILKAMRDCNMEPTFGRQRKLDLLSVAWLTVHETNIMGFGLKHLCDHFNISNVGEHRALRDCYRAFEVYKCLVKMHKEKK